MNIRIQSAITGAVVVVFMAGCASDKSAQSAPPTKARYVTVAPETGSRVPRRVRVNEDGSLEKGPSDVLTVDPEAMGDIQRKGSVTGGGTGN